METLRHLIMDLRNLKADLKDYKKWCDVLHGKLEEVPPLDGETEQETISNVAEEIIKEMSYPKESLFFREDFRTIEDFSSMIDSLFEYRTKMNGVIYGIKITGLKLSKGEEEIETFIIKDSDNYILRELTMDDIREITRENIGGSKTEYIVCGIAFEYQIVDKMETFSIEYNMN